MSFNGSTFKHIVLGLFLNISLAYIKQKKNS